MSTEQFSVKHQFDRDGYVVLRGFLPATEIDDLNDQVARYIREVVPTLPPEDLAAMYEVKNDPLTLKQLEHMELYDDYFKAFLSAPRFLRLGSRLLEGPVVPKNQQWFDKPPGKSSETPAHQDGFYFKISPNEAINMWLALDSIDEGNGCMHYLPRSHKQGVREHHRTEILGFSQGLEYTDQDRAIEIAISVEPGDLVVHHSLTIHRANQNPSQRRRRAMGGIYYSDRACEDQRAYEEYNRRLANDLVRHGRI